MCWGETVTVDGGRVVLTVCSVPLQYVGFWSQGKRSGQGELISEAARFVGNFTDDKPLGAGRFTFPHGCEQPGEYVVDEGAEEPAGDEETPSTPATQWQGAGFEKAAVVA